jgi:hypothetical protein
MHAMHGPPYRREMTGKFTEGTLDNLHVHPVYGRLACPRCQGAAKAIAADCQAHSGGRALVVGMNAPHGMLGRQVKP